MAEVKKRYDEIDILKGIAIIFVLLSHAIIVFPINLLEVNWCNFLFRFMRLVHMPLFFIASGFCCKKVEKYNYVSFIMKKIKRLIVPYIVVNLIDIFPRVFFIQLINRPLGFHDSVKKIIFYGGEYWFLYTLFAMFIIFPFLQRIIENSKTKQIILILILLLFHLINLQTKIFTLDRLLRFYIFFYCGYLIKIYFTAIKYFYIKNIKKYLNNIYMLSLFIWIFIAYYDNTLIPVKFLGRISALIYLVLVVINTKNNKLLNILKNIGQVSLQLYLLNGFFLFITRYIVINILGINNPLMIITLNMSVMLGLSYFVITRIFMKVKFLKILFGIM